MAWQYETDLLQVRLHDLGSIVDSQNDISHTGLGQGLNLVLDHGLVGELNEGLGQGQGLHRWLLADQLIVLYCRISRWSARTPISEHTLG